MKLKQNLLTFDIFFFFVKYVAFVITGTIYVECNFDRIKIDSTIQVILHNVSSVKHQLLPDFDQIDVDSLKSFFSTHGNGGLCHIQVIFKAIKHWWTNKISLMSQNMSNCLNVKSPMKYFLLKQNAQLLLNKVVRPLTHQISLIITVCVNQTFFCYCRFFVVSSFVIMF